MNEIQKKNLEMFLEGLPENEHDTIREKMQEYVDFLEPYYKKGELEKAETWLIGFVVIRKLFQNGGDANDRFSYDALMNRILEVGARDEDDDAPQKCLELAEYFRV